MLKIIPRSRLEPHPDNPRKELGDLTELAASIQRSGLLQNLTVVPHPEKDGYYRILIGHRRFAASELAGLDELPCSVENMSPADQVATMLAENMQRTDLTIADQVGGVQVMLDLGENATSIAVKTGLSSTTIRKREKLSKLDFDKLKAAEQRGATLLKLMEVESIEDPSQRDRALEALGTVDYNRVMFDIKRENELKKYKPLLIEALSEYAERVDAATARDKGVYQQWFYATAESVKLAKEFKPSQDSQYIFTVDDNGNGQLYKRITEQQTEESRKKAEARERIQKRIEAEKALRKRFEEYRRVFLLDAAFGLTNERDVQRFVLWSMTRTKFQTTPKKDGLLAEAMPDVKAIDTNSVVPNVQQIEEHSERVGDMLRLILFAAYDRVDIADISLLDSYAGYFNARELPLIQDMYYFLERLGYSVSDEERQWMDGSHGVFTEEMT